MWWKWALRAAIAVGLDKWAKKKAVELAGKLRKKAVDKADGLLETVGEKLVKPAAGTIVLREDRDTLRPGSIVLRDSKSYRVTKLLSVSPLGAFYEAKAE